MSHALLLRLFLSPYFSISVAMHYLKTYSDSIGISHYLCWRMRGMSADEVESYWPQICHLLITYPTQSNALESFVIQRAEQSTHSAMLTFWFMQAALRDLTPTRQTNPRPFLICQRILHRCHEIIFGDVPEPGPGRSPYRSLPVSPNGLSRLGGESTGNQLHGGKVAVVGGSRVKVNSHALPALVGMGVILSAQGMPALRETAGEWAIMQGRQPRDDDTQGRERAEGDQPEGANEPKGRGLEKSIRGSTSPKRERGQSGVSRDEDQDTGGTSGDAEEKRGRASVGTPRISQQPPSPRHHPSLTAPDLSTPPPRHSIDRLPIYPQSSPLLNTPPDAPIDPFSMEDSDPFPASIATPLPTSASLSSSTTKPQNRFPVAQQSSHQHHNLHNQQLQHQHQHHHSFPELSHLGTPARPSSAGPSSNGRFSHSGYGDRPIPPDILLANYSMDKQRQLLKSHYTRSEIRFLLLLEDISNRLLVVPKPARVSALRAELTSLNHNLPAEVCMPLWCTADHSHDNPSVSTTASSVLSPSKLLPERRQSSWSTSKKGHSRVVRISPGDSVVLNSAERAPFLLHVEILEGDLDFDPTKRENRELLKKIVAQEDVRRRKKEMGAGNAVDLTFEGNGSGSGSSSRRNGSGIGGVGLGIDGFGSAMPEALPQPRTPIVHPRTVPDFDSSAGGDIGVSSQGAPSRRTLKEEAEVEEVDLVEQMYGTRISVRNTLPDLTDSLPLPSGPKNKALDMAAWDRHGSTSSGPSRRTSYSVSTSIPTSASVPIPAGQADALGALGQDPAGLAQLSEINGAEGPRSGSLQRSSLPADPDSRRHSATIGAMIDDKSNALRHDSEPKPKRVITLEDYSERMRTAAVMLAQLNASLIPVVPEGNTGRTSWIPGTGWILGGGSGNSGSGAGPTSTTPGSAPITPLPIFGTSGPGGGGTGTDGPVTVGSGGKLRLAAAQAEAIRVRIMEEMMALEEERVARMTGQPEGEVVLRVRTATESDGAGGSNGGGEGAAAREGSAEDEGIVRRELNKADPSAAIFKESWAAKKTRIRASSPWGHLANWDVISVIVKTGTDLRQEQLATQLIERFSRIFREEKCDCWVRFFRILITGEQSGLVETITDAVSVHSIKKGEYARRLAEGGPMGRVSLMDHFVNTYGTPDSGRFARAQRAFIRSLAGYSVVTYLLQIKDRHNGNILVDRDGHLIHIDFGFMLSNSPGGNMGFEAAPFKFPLEYVEILGGLESSGWKEFKRVFKEGFEAARKHSDSLITMVELMQKDSKLDCFALFGDQTAHHFRERFALGLTTAAVDAHLERLIVSSMGSNYTRLYDTFQYYSQGVL